MTFPMVRRRRDVGARSVFGVPNDPPLGPLVARCGSPTWCGRARLFCARIGTGHRPEWALPRVLGVVRLVVAEVFGAMAILSSGVLALSDEDAQAGDSEHG